MIAAAHLVAGRAFGVGLQHCFHEHCLNRWMVVKMTCPTCRGRLPASPELAVFGEAAENERSEA